MNKWEEKFPVGSIVYYFKKQGLDWDIELGTADSHYVDALCIQTYTFKENRLINGIPYNDFVPDERRKKLPKGWTYNTELYEQTEEYDDINMYNFKNPDDMLKAIKDGVIIKTEDKDFSHIDVDITKEGWKLRKTFYPYEQIPSNLVSRPYNECFTTYDEALNVRKAHNGEILRQRDLSDYDWSLEQIDKTLNKAMGLNLITEGQANFIRGQLLKEDVENIETRISMGKVQWKPWKNKRWMEINC